LPSILKSSDEFSKMALMQKREMIIWESQSIVAKDGPSVKTEQVLGKKNSPMTKKVEYFTTKAAIIQLTHLSSTVPKRGKYPGKLPKTWRCFQW
jgi:hypothetical protein